MPSSSPLTQNTGQASSLVWQPDQDPPAFEAAEICALSASIRTPVHVIFDPQQRRMGLAGGGRLLPADSASAGWPVQASLAPLYPEWLGERSFAECHGCRFAYIAGAMANGIASARMVSEMARAGMLAMFGAAGLSPRRVADELAGLQQTLGSELPWGANLIHSPSEPDLEMRICELLLEHRVRCVEASAYMALTPAVVRFAVSGLWQDREGRVQRRHRLIAKVSREEVARRFLEPAPAAILAELLAQGHIDASQARMAESVPLAEDITVEADSGGHTDNRPLTALLPAIARLRDDIAARHRYPMPIRIGAAGGLGTPAAVAAAFALGAAYVQTGSVNQGCVESGLGERGRQMLAQAEMADVIMAPAADMFEMGVNVQVLRRGTMFAGRARKLYELYRRWPSLEAIPAEERSKLESSVLKASFDEAWASTRSFWMQRDAREVERAEHDPKHRMALVFRAYLGLSSRWAIDDVEDRGNDYQIWCGPAMGAFNRWAQGSFLESAGQRQVVQVALNLLEGASVISRAQQLRCAGLAMPTQAFDFKPRRLR